MLYLLFRRGIGGGMESEIELPEHASHGHSHGQWLDRAAIGLSGLCIVHCVGTAILVAVLASAGSALLNPAIHEVGLMFAMALAAAALGRGFLVHGFMKPLAVGGAGLFMMALGLALPEGASEMMATISGVSLVAVAHGLNRRALR